MFIEKRIRNIYVCLQHCDFAFETTNCLEIYNNFFFVTTFVADLLRIKAAFYTNIRYIYVVPKFTSL